MIARTFLSETWLSRKPRPGAFDLTLGLVALCVLATFANTTAFFGLEGTLAASPEAVFQRHEFWRAWLALFAHADIGHLLSNMLLFLPFSYFLAGHFSRWFYPGFALLAGGLNNLVVLATQPAHSTLVGLSGVVYWMGAAWLTLYLLIERREPIRRRLGKVVITTAAVFLPDTVRPEVSYLSHYLGFATGVAITLLFYRLQRAQIRAAEKYQTEFEEEIIPEEEWRVEQSSP